MEPGTLAYEPPFGKLHSGGPDGLFTGKDNVIEGIFQTMEEVHTGCWDNGEADRDDRAAV
ncbi:hypothetical protein [Pelovirga terrestris]|uniref:Uncharacterized protein n=1 Tax=Pelovirga terrestris TaxID=2771352 RepID=A0A8J6QX00_9BACT|nr:hypothetical protein [Pelovirga terrestris]MBD1400383.1 hypothetical protein [Pelovirga terrestris]